MFKARPTHVGFGFEMLATVSPVLWPEIPRLLVWLIALFGLSLIFWGGVIPVVVWVASRLRPTKGESLDYRKPDQRLDPETRTKKSVDRFVTITFIVWSVLVSLIFATFINIFGISEGVVFGWFIALTFIGMLAIQLYNREKPIAKTVQGKAYFWWVRSSWKVRHWWNSR